MDFNPISGEGMCAQLITNSIMGNVVKYKVIFVPLDVVKKTINVFVFKIK
jgi:hypothetical protein